MERMEKQTAVDYIFHTFYNEDNISDYVLRIFEQAKEMEKEQMMQCYEDGYNRVVKLIEDATQRNLNL
jgi:hypothetical protein